MKELVSKTVPEHICLNKPMNIADPVCKYFIMVLFLSLLMLLHDIVDYMIDCNELYYH